MAEFILCVDVGNSRTKIGLLGDNPQRELASQLPECVDSAAVAHGQPIPWSKISANLPAHALDGLRAWIAGSNPDGVAAVHRSWPRGWPEPTVLNDVATFPLRINLDAPNKAGVDRILNAIACNVIRPPGRPAVIVDSGTATTVDAVSPEGAFEGGAILPGFELCGRALNQYTALLPFVTIEELSEESHEPLGRNTREALRSGLLWGQIGAIKELVAHLSRRWEAAPFLVLTGGGAPLAAPHLPECRWEPNLSLQGLAIVARHLRKV